MKSLACDGDRAARRGSGAPGVAWWLTGTNLPPPADTNPPLRTPAPDRLGVDAKTATEINKIFLEIIIAPGFSKEALDILTLKKNKPISLSLEAITLRRNQTQKTRIIEYVVIVKVVQAIFEDQFSDSSGFQPVRTLPLMSRPLVSD